MNQVNALEGQHTIQHRLRNIPLAKAGKKTYIKTVRFESKLMAKAEELKNQGAKFLGLNYSKIGKTQARQKFFPLVEDLHKTCSAVEITDHEKPVAILLSYNHWVALMSKVAMLSKQERLVKPPDLVGSIEIINDLDAASKKLAAKFSRSHKNTPEIL